MQKIEPNYMEKSNDASRSCGSCVNFQPVPGSEADGRCFGNEVTKEGLCDFHSTDQQNAGDCAAN